MNTALVDKCHDGDLADPVTIREHHRVHWMCSQATGHDVLHVGCGNGTACLVLGREGFRCTGVDTREPGLISAQQALANEHDLIRRRVTFQFADATQLPFDDASFDTVILGELLEHLTHPTTVISEAHRVLRDNGRLVVTVPCGLNGFDSGCTYYPTTLIELLQPHFRTSSIDVSEGSILYTGIKDSAYRFDEVPRESLFTQYVRLGQAIEARCLENERAILEIGARCSKHRQSLTAQISRVEELEGALENLRGELADWRRRLETAQAENAALRQEVVAKSAASQERVAQIERLHAAKLRESERHFQELLEKRDAEAIRKAASARLRDVVRAALPVDARVLVISNGDDDLIQLEGRYGMHFPQAASGVYAGYHPKDAAAAIGHLETLQSKGAKYLLIPADSFWWLEFYEDFRRYLEANGRLLLYDASTCVIYGLRAPRADESFTCSIRLQQDHPVESSDTIETPSCATRADNLTSQSDPTSGEKSDLLTLGVILDEFTTDCLRPECRLLTLRPDRWKKALEQDRPEAILVESAWSGNNGAWLNRLANLQSRPEHDLQELLQWAQQRSIPSIFWNKEDPVHFDRFIDAARLFSHVFTTDAGCIPQYQQQLGHDRIFALPFAAQPAIHNPIQTDPRDGNVCFAGTYYGSRHAARQADMEYLLRPAIPYGLEIYDRQHGLNGKGTEVYSFPDIYQPCIQGRLDYADMVKAYKRYRIFLNVNSVKHSSTMFSRRVFELLASGTPVISTYSAGIVELLGEDVVFLSETEAETRGHLERLLGDEEQWARASVRGIRKVLGEHTYRHRLQEVFERVGLTLPSPSAPQISIVARADSASEVNRLAAMLSVQTYRRFDVVLLSKTPLPAHAFEPLLNALPEVQVVPLVGSPDVVCEACLGASTAEYVAFLNVRDWYGPNYLLDYSIAIMYSQADFLGKHTHYEANSRGEPRLSQSGHEFRYVASVPSASLVARKAAVGLELFKQAVSRPVVQSGEHLILSTDRFNYLHVASVCDKTNRRRDEESVEIERVYV